MSERAALAGQAIKVVTPARSAIRHAMPVVMLVLIDLTSSVLAFVFAYKLRQHTDIFEWRHRKSFFPVGIYDDFEPYLSFLAFVPLVKVYVLHRYGLYRLRGEFSFSTDLFKVLNASTLAFLVLVMMAFLFRQGFAIREGHLISIDFSYSRLVFVYDWLISMGLFLTTRFVVR